MSENTVPEDDQEGEEIELEFTDGVGGTDPLP